MKKILLSIFSAALICTQPLTACGPSLYNDETRYALFRNGLDGYSGLEAFYYTENFLNGSVSDPQGLDYMKNCEEWQRYSRDADMNIDHIYTIQYLTEPEVFLKAWSQNDWSAFRKNDFIKWLIQPRNKRAMAYMVLAKEAEQTQFGTSDIWSVDTALTQRTAAIRMLAAKSMEQARKAKDNFLKERYTFQAVKMAYYGNFQESDGSARPFLDIYEKNIAKGNSVVKGWGAYFCGLMEAVNSDAYVIRMLQAFDWSEEKKVPVYNQLNNIRDQVYAVGKKRPDLEEVSLALFGAMTFGKNLPQIRQVYKLNPGSKYLPFLIGREINKVENWIWSYDLLRFDNLNDDLLLQTSYETNRKNDHVYLNDLIVFIEKAEQDGKADPVFCKLALLHLLNLKGKHEDAKKVMARLTVPTGGRYYEQFLIERIIITAKTENILTNDVKLKLAADLIWLKDREDAFRKEVLAAAGGGDPYGMPELDTEELDDVSELMVFLSYCYKERGDMLTAGLLRHKANIPSNEYGYMDWTSWYYLQKEQQDNGINPANNYHSIAYFDKYGSVEDIYNLIMFKHKQQKTRFEQLLEPVRWADDEMFYDLIGTKHLREQQYDMALQVFEKINPVFWEKQYAYQEFLPLQSIFDLGSYTPWESQKYTPYTTTSKTAILRDIVRVTKELAQPALKPERRSQLLLMLGNAQLNMTYNGYFWMMMSYGKYYMETYEEKDDIFRYTFYPNTIKYGEAYYRNGLALQTLQQSYLLATGKEQKAAAFLSICLAEKLALGDIYPQRILPKEVTATKIYNTARTFCPDLDGRF